MNKANDKLHYPVALTIAGSDSGGGAGIQADLKAFSALGVYGTSAITAITAQNTLGVRGIQAVTPEMLRAQIDAVMEDLFPDAVKIGMLHNRETVAVVAEALEHYRPRWVVLDPVMVSTSGSRLLADDTIEGLVRLLFSRAHLLTPNLKETECLTGMSVTDEAEMERAARRLLEMGCQAVLVKGGHLAAGCPKVDLLVTADGLVERYVAPDILTRNTHGTGCTLSSAIAAFLAREESLPDAIRCAKQYVTDALAAGADVEIGEGFGPVDHFFRPVPLIKRRGESWRNS